MGAYGQSHGLGVAGLLCAVPRLRGARSKRLSLYSTMPTLWFTRRPFAFSAGSVRGSAYGAERSLQWLVPLLLAIYFFVERKPVAFAFCLFFFFENFRYTATYMADARVMQLPLVSAGGDGSEPEHDWNTIFSHLGVLQYDTRIANVIRSLGWVGMLSTTGWLAFQSWRTRNASAELAHLSEVK